MAMRRGILFLLLCALVSGALPAAASQPGAGAGAGHAAEAFWVDVKAGSFYFAEGYRMVGAGGVESSVAVGRGRCTKERMGRTTLVSCFGKGVAKEASLDEFTFDPTLKTAHVDVVIAKQQHTVEWATEDPPAADWNTGVASQGVSINLSAGVFANASGEVFGHKVSTKSFDDLAFLYEGAGIDVYQFGPGGRFEIEFSFQVS
jgi:hypothetical protein